MFYIILIIDIYIYMYIHSITIDEQPIFLSVWGAQIFILSSSNHHPDTLSLVSDIPSGSIYGIYIYNIFCLTFFWHSICHMLWHPIWQSFRHLHNLKLYVRVQAWPTASGARNMVRSHSCPQSELGKEETKRRRRRRKREKELHLF